MIKKYFLYIGIVFVLIISVFMSWAKQQIAYEHIKDAALNKLTLAEEIISKPQMPIIEVAGPKGDIITLPKKDQFTLVALWSVKCRDCIKNLHTLNKLQGIFLGYNEKWEVIGVSIDTPDNLNKVTELIKNYKLSRIAEYYDAHGTLRKYVAPKTIPVTLIIDDKGRVLYKVYGIAPWLNHDVIAYLRTMTNKKQ